LQSDPKQSLRNVRAAILGLVADTQNRIADGLTAADVFSAMETANVPIQDQESLRTLLDTIESAEYGAAGESLPSELIPEAAKLVSRIGPLLQRSVK